MGSVEFAFFWSGDGLCFWLLNRSAEGKILTANCTSAHQLRRSSLRAVVNLKPNRPH